MPCDIGYRSYARIEIPVPTPQDFSVKFEAPQIDEDLLEKLGIEDPDFLSNLAELDVKEFLEIALQRALENVDADGISFRVDDEGMLRAKGKFITPAEKRQLQETTRAISNRWQFEILGIVAELLGYDITIVQNGDELTIIAEERGKAHPSDSIRITKKGNQSDITFEHFKTRKKFDIAAGKFLALAERLGIKLKVHEWDVKLGRPHPESQSDAIEGRHSHGNYSHEHN